MAKIGCLTQVPLPLSVPIRMFENSPWFNGCNLQDKLQVCPGTKKSQRVSKEILKLGLEFHEWVALGTNFEMFRTLRIFEYRLIQMKF